VRDPAAAADDEGEGAAGGGGWFSTRGPLCWVGPPGAAVAPAAGGACGAVGRSAVAALHGPEPAGDGGTGGGGDSDGAAAVAR
jgi:hypothetical protein